MTTKQLEQLMFDLLKKHLTPEQKARLIRVKLNKGRN